MDSEKEKNRLSDIVLERVGLTGNLLSAPVSPSLEPVVEIPSHGSQVRAGKVTGPEAVSYTHLTLPTSDLV